MYKTLVEDLLILVNSGGSPQEVKSFMRGAISAAFVFGRPGISEDLEKWASEHGIKKGKIVNWDENDKEICAL